LKHIIEIGKVAAYVAENEGHEKRTIKTPRTVTVGDDRLKFPNY
jgi:hypothetical protein